MEEVDSTMTNLNKLVDLARQNTDEGWDQVDRLLPQHADQQDFFDWAGKNLENSDSGLRDLAASIFELTSLPLNDVVVESLFRLMRETDEENPYPSFRAACALAKRHDDERVSGEIDKVRGKLRGFIEDKGVSKIAKSYLQRTE